MSAERMPQEKGSFIEKPLLGLTRLVLRFPITTLILGGLLAVAATVYSNAHLGFRTSRLDLLNPKSEFNRLWIDYINEFGDQEDVVVVVEGSQPETILAAKNEIAAAIGRETKLFHSVLNEIDTSKLRDKGLYYLPVEQLHQIEGFLDQTEPIVRNQWACLNVGTMAGEMCHEMQQAGARGQAIPPEAQAMLARFLTSIRAGLDGRYQSPWPEIERPAAIPDEPSSSQLLSNDRRMGFVLLKLATDEDSSDFVRGSKPIEVLRQLIAQAQARHPETKIGLTGLPVIEHDEMASSQTSMAEVSLVSFLGVSLLFVAGFGGWRHPLLAVLSLSIGTAWSMGYITLAIGHLNILSSAFGVILIGQGIDFSMYYVAQYLQLRKTVPSSRDALVQTVAEVGPGVATGAVTTAVAFFMAGLTEFIGVAELGIIAGGGILICWIAGLTVLPAMIHLVDTKWPSKHVPVPVDVRGWLEPVLSRPRLLLVATSALTIFLAWGVSQLEYDHNLLHLQARGLESVDLEQRLLGQKEHNATFAISIAPNREDLLARKVRLEGLPSVSRVEDIVSRLPEGVEAKQPILERVFRRLADLPQRAPKIPASNPADLAQIGAIAQAMTAQGRPATAFQGAIEGMFRQLQQMPPEECYGRLSEFQQRMAEDLLARLHALRNAASPEPPQLTDLPQSLISRFVSPSGRYLLKVYSKCDIWDMSQLEQFVREVRSVDPRATGNPLQVYEASRQMQRSYEEAALYAMAIILPVVFLDFLSVRRTLLALLPLGLGMVQMFGLMGVLKIPLNPANMIVLPLILGIGIDAGVHVVHDYISQKGRYRINASTASAVVINTVTNMAGFGSLMIASHRGLQSLGRVLTIGLACCLFTSLIMLPAMLMLFGRKRKASGEEDPVARARMATQSVDAENDESEPFSGPAPRLLRRDGPHTMTPQPHSVPESTPHMRMQQYRPEDVAPVVRRVARERQRQE